MTLIVVLELNEPRARGNITHAAELLGTTRQSLQRRMRRLGVKDLRRA